MTVHSVEEADGVHFITMELVEGQTLAKLLPKSGFPSERLLEIAIPLADAVSSAHRAGITHRDLKPDNIMVDDEGRLRVLDFGLAKLHDTVELRGGRHAGRRRPPPSPRRGRSSAPSPTCRPSRPRASPSIRARTSSRWARSSTRWPRGSGRSAATRSMSTIGSILKDEPASVTELNPSLPRHLGRIIRRCLAKDPDRRYQTALDLRNELEELKAEIDSGELRGRARAAAICPAEAFFRPLSSSVSVAALAIVAVIAITSARIRRAPPTVYVSRPITSAIGQEADINWSPESEFIAFGQHS